MYSSDIFSSLFHAYLDDEYERNRDFWYIVDRLDMNHLVLWANRLVISKHLSNNDPEAWLDVIDIIRLTRVPEVKLTNKQKRYMAMCVISYWNELSCDYEI